MSSAGRGQKGFSARAYKKELLGSGGKGKVNAAIELLKGASEWVRNPAAVEEIIAYLEKRRAYIPNYQQRQRAGLWIAEHTGGEDPMVGGVGTLQTPGDELVATRGCWPWPGWSLARRNGELNARRRGGALPERALPEPVRKAA